MPSECHIAGVCTIRRNTLRYCALRGYVMKAAARRKAIDNGPLFLLPCWKKCIKD